MAVAEISRPADRKEPQIKFSYLRADVRDGFLAITGRVLVNGEGADGLSVVVWGDAYGFTTTGSDGFFVLKVPFESAYGEIVARAYDAEGRSSEKVYADFYE